ARRHPDPTLSPYTPLFRSELQAAYPGIQIDATVSRQMWTAPDILRGLRDAGALRPVVIVALGTNGSVGDETLAAIRDVIGPEREDRKSTRLNSSHVKISYA